MNRNTPIAFLTNPPRWNGDWGARKRALSERDPRSIHYIPGSEPLTQTERAELETLTYSLTNHLLELK